MLESIKKLREYAKSEDVFYQDILDYADAIEREVSERYMLRPVDADGVPIHAGDYVTSERGGIIGKKAGVVATVYLVGYSVDPCCLHHVKPRTVENVLRDFGVDAAHELNANPNATISEATIAKYVAEISELLGGDA